MACSICGQKGIYQVNGKEFCVNHKSEATAASGATRYQQVKKKSITCKDCGKRVQISVEAMDYQQCFFCRRAKIGQSGRGGRRAGVTIQCLYARGSDLHKRRWDRPTPTMGGE
jgi:Zn finger protein HypA/HybF involved in hydrogenase expression